MRQIDRIIIALAVLAVELAVILSNIYEPHSLVLIPARWLIMAAGMSR